jgi:hypothetical protein
VEALRSIALGRLATLDLSAANDLNLWLKAFGRNLLDNRRPFRKSEFLPVEVLRLLLR